MNEKRCLTYLKCFFSQAQNSLLLDLNQEYTRKINNKNGMEGVLKLEKKAFQIYTLIPSPFFSLLFFFSFIYSYLLYVRSSRNNFFS